MQNPIDQTRSDFIEKIGLNSQNDGLPRIAGRVLGLLIWDGEAVAFGDLADRLQVSRGSISTATRILEARRLIRRITKPGVRQDFFQLSENPYEKMLESVAAGLERAKEQIDETLNEIPDTEPEIRARVAAYSEFYGQMSGAVATMITKD